MYYELFTFHLCGKSLIHFNAYVSLYNDFFLFIYVLLTLTVPYLQEEETE